MVFSKWTFSLWKAHHIFRISLISPRTDKNSTPWDKGLTTSIWESLILSADWSDMILGKVPIVCVCACVCVCVRERERERWECLYKINYLLQKQVGLRQLSSVHVVCWSHRGYMAQIQFNIIPRGQILWHPVICLSAVRELQARDPCASKAGKDDIRLSKSPGKVHDLWKWHLRGPSKDGWG